LLTQHVYVAVYWRNYPDRSVYGRSCREGHAQILLVWWIRLHCK